MAKPSPMLQKLIARERAEAALRVDRAVSFAKALTQDAAVLAANEVLGLGQGRVVEFVMALCRHILDWQEAISEDRADDPEIAFAKERIDRLLRPIYGDWMPEFDVRYGLAPAPQEKLNVPEKQLAGVRRKEQERKDRALRRAETDTSSTAGGPPSPRGEGTEGKGSE